MSQPESDQSETTPDGETAEASLLDSDVADITDLDGPVVDSAEGATEPSRNPDYITSILGNINRGTTVKIVFGTADWKVSLTGEVVGLKGQNCSRPPDAGWTKTIEVLGPEGGEKQGRLYRMGTGGGNADPWLIYSYNYYPKLDMLTQEDAAWHGWITNAQRLPDNW